MADSIGGEAGAGNGVAINMVPTAWLPVYTLAMRSGLKNEILGLLYDRREQFTSLAELSALIGLERAKLQLALDELSHAGQRLDAWPAHGVKLISPVRMHAHLIERNLGTLRAGRHVICFDEVGSTNDVALDSARQADSDGLVVLAESQRQGRGRLGRKWVSPPGSNILLSLLLVDEHGQLAQEALTIAAGLAVAEGISQACGVEGQLKWPNDVMLDSAKLAGVLVEIKNVPVSPPGVGNASRSSKSRRCVVVGLGVNVNAAPSGEFHRPAVCLSDHLGAPVERVEVVRQILGRLDYWVGQIAAGELGLLRDRWLGRCEMVGQRITVLCAGLRYTGRVLDVSPLEGLLLCRDEGPTVHLPSGKSSLVD
jgi:BirA family biotin operon repressor/biotin-[acetyl-CoA-carboxylase] ligase